MHCRRNTSCDHSAMLRPPYKGVRIAPLPLRRAVGSRRGSEMTTCAGGVQHRVKNRPLPERRLMGLLRAVHRYRRCRAVTRGEREWPAVMIEALTATLDTARHAPGATTRPGRTVRPDDDRRHWK